MAKNLLLIDGNSLFHRAYHALPTLTDKKGEAAQAVYGFSNMLIKAIAEVKPDYVGCAFDTAAATFRHLEFEEYKAKRPPPPPDLYPQLPKIKKVLNAFSIPYFEKEGYEADDLLATLAIRSLGLSLSEIRKGKKTDLEVVILSGDRDVLQLVDGAIRVQMPGWNLKEVTLFGSKEVLEKFGVTPEQMVDYKSLTGDPSDNIPGVAGIGPKTASGLLKEFGTLEKVFASLEDIPENLRKKLESGRDLALSAKRLVELDCNVDIEFDLEKLKFNPDWERVRKEYEDLGFKSIAAKIKGSGVPEVPEEPEEPKETEDDQLELI